MKNKSILLIIYLSILILSCKPKSEEQHVEDNIKKLSKIEQLIKELNNPNGENILVIAHRGDWRNAPENSVQAVQNCINMGVDMVEIDVRKTKDNQLVVIHDNTLNRTTTGKGRISEWTLDSLNTINLKNGAGVPTKHKVPTLEEVLLIAKDEILINLDKCYDYFDEAFEVAKRTGTSNQIVIKGYNKTVDEVTKDFGSKLDSIIFMPIINLDKQNNAQQLIDDYQRILKVKAFEIVFSTDSSHVLNRFPQIRRNGSRVWVNSLWASLNAGYEDDAAVKNVDSIYGWYKWKGVNMIQTDRPQLLLNYLRSKKLHN